MPKGRAADIVIPYRPRGVWEAFHASTARWRVAVAHRRAGKTVAFVNEAIRGALTCERPDPRFGYCRRQKLKGLVARRAAEVVLWSTEEPGSDVAEPPSSFTRDAPTPPAHSSPTPLFRQPAFLATAAALALGAPDAIAKIAAALTPYADRPIAAQLLETLSNLGPVAAALGALVLWLQSQQAKR